MNIIRGDRKNAEALGLAGVQSVVLFPAALTVLAGPGRRFPGE